MLNGFFARGFLQNVISFYGALFMQNGLWSSLFQSKVSVKTYRGDGQGDKPVADPSQKAAPYDLSK